MCDLKGTIPYEEHFTVEWSESEFTRKERARYLWNGIAGEHH